jgi:integrase
MRAATVETLIGLLAATGMRVGEAIRFERRDLGAWVRTGKRSRLEAR